MSKCSGCNRSLIHVSLQFLTHFCQTQHLYAQSSHALSMPQHCVWYSEGLDHSSLLELEHSSLLGAITQRLGLRQGLGLRSAGTSSLSSFFDFSGAAAGFFFNSSGIFLATGLGFALGLGICLFTVFPHPLPVQILNSSGADLFDLAFALFVLPFAALDSVDEWLDFVDEVLDDVDLSQRRGATHGPDSSDDLDVGIRERFVADFITFMALFGAIAE